jgi:hypothetical protein
LVLLILHTGTTITAAQLVPLKSTRSPIVPSNEPLAGLPVPISVLSGVHRSPP